ncbi:MAG: aminotransferase class V-fold PLP-dependent enzyme, partial [Brevibacterium linens]|uniref:aminotransferase class V-fold PLP-dependent enzyme n=1 Tax=Brevibacterium linens TaxID=1703 RepID=UPI003F990F14
MPWPRWAESVDSSRELFGRLVGVPADQVATGAAVSQLLAPIATALPDGAGVLIPDIEFTSGVYPFAVHADRGVRVRTAPLDTLAEAVDASTTLVSFSAAQSATGEVADLPAVTRAAREVGALTVLDGTQAAGWLPISAADVDFLAVAAYKWLCAPRGTAFLTMPSQLAAAHDDQTHRAEFFDRLKPLAAGWFAARGSGQLRDADASGRRCPRLRHLTGPALVGRHGARARAAARRRRRPDPHSRFRLGQAFQNRARP